MRIHGIAAMAATLAFGAPALAQDYVERPYDPPVGSRWQIVSQSDTDENRETEKRDQHINMTAELTVEEKLPDGFRIAYVTRNIAVTGNVPGGAIAGSAFQSLKDVVIRARTDRSGKPLVIENIDEARGKMRAAVDAMTAAFQSKPQVAAIIRQMLESMLLADAKEAARTYIEEVPALASVQNTGLKPNQSMRTFDDVPSPLGGNIRSVVVTTLTAWDNVRGTAQYHRTREFDKDAMQAVVLAMVRKLQPASDGQITPQMIEMMKQIRFTMTSESVFTVENGMARGVVENSTIEVSLAGHTFTKVEKKKVAVTPLPKL